ncbi:hypothetical protein ACTA71_010429 [Dictyostelium dimigraforme]
MSMVLTKVPPFHYIHVLDTNIQIVKMIEGPISYLVKEHEKIVIQPTKMHVIQNNEYCIIESPVIRDQDKKTVLIDKYGQAKLKHGSREIRFESGEPFPLYPGESIVGKISPLTVILNNEAIVIRALVDFLDTKTSKLISAGDEWLMYGPATYKPRVEEYVKEIRKAFIVKPHNALKIMATNDFKDKVYKQQRKSGDEWLMAVEGPYILDAYEKLVEIVEPYVLDDNNSIHVVANRKFMDGGNDGGIERKKGDKWLLTKQDTTLFIPQPCVTVEKVVPVTTLTQLDYVIITDPYDEETSAPLLGKKKIVRGPKNFFQKPGETISVIKQALILEPEDAVYVKVLEEFEDSFFVNNTLKNVTRKSGTKYLVYGPCEYVPPLSVQVLKKTKAIISNEQFQIYIFDLMPAISSLIILLLIYLILKFLF